MTEAELRALFTLANIPILKLMQANNPYHGAPTERNAIFGPQWIVISDLGVITLHWRKRVIEIDWSGTPLRFPLIDQFGRTDITTDNKLTFDDVTQNETFVHAYTYGKAVDYLYLIKARVQRAIYINAFNERKAAENLTDIELNYIASVKRHAEAEAAESKKEIV